MKLAINAVSAKQGGAVTYLQNVLPELRRRLDDASEIVVWRAPTETGDDRWPAGIEYREDAVASGAQAGAVGANPLRRLLFDQVGLPLTLRREGFDVLFSSANFGPLVTSCRHVLLVRNALYFDRTALGRIRSKRVLAFFAAQRALTLAAMRTADCVLFPSESMRDLVAEFAGGSRRGWRVAPYGTRHDAFRRDGAPRTITDAPRVELLNVSLYSEQKNLGTLFAAMDHLEREAPGRFRVRLTAGLRRDWQASSRFFPHFVEERAQFARLDAAGVAEDVDWKRYGSLPALYHSADIFVFPSYSESFGHPLVEAMAAGLPVVAADVPICREMCGDAAVYFSPFDAGACAAAIRRVAEDPALAERMRRAAAIKAQTFTWARHVDALIGAFTR